MSTWCRNIVNTLQTNFIRGLSKSAQAAIASLKRSCFRRRFTYHSKEKKNKLSLFFIFIILLPWVYHSAPNVNNCFYVAQEQKWLDWQSLFKVSQHRKYKMFCYNKLILVIWVCVNLFFSASTSSVGVLLERFQHAADWTSGSSPGGHCAGRSLWALGILTLISELCAGL